MNRVMDYLQARSQKIVKVASRGSEDTFPAIAVVIGKGVRREALRALGARRIGDVVEMSPSAIASISEIDPNFARWARRTDGRVRVFFAEGLGSLLINIYCPEDGNVVEVSLEPGSTDEERAAVAS